MNFTYRILILPIIYLIISCNTKEKKDYHLFYRFGSIPYEIKINDVICEIDLAGGMPGPTEINQYLLKSGSQKISIKVIHPYLKKGKMFKPNDLGFLNKNLLIADVQYDDEGEIIIDTIAKLNFPEITNEAPFIVNEWTFDASLPFTIKGWSQSEDLSKWDEDKLEEKVVSKFKDLRSLLNSGNGKQFVNQLKKANEEYFIANYWNEKKQAEYLENLANDYNKLEGLVPEIENYRVRIMGGGKAVALEALDKHIGQGILTTENKEKKKLYLNYIVLHKPKNSERFEVIRYNSNITSLE